MLGLVPAAGAVTFTNDTVIGYTNAAYDGQEIVVTNCTVTVDGAHSFLDVHVLNAGILTHTAAPNAVLATNGTNVIYAGLNLVVTNNVEIEIGGAINANGKGYGAGLGLGAGTSQLTNYPYSYYAGSGAGKPPDRFLCLQVSSAVAVVNGG